MSAQTRLLPALARVAVTSLVSTTGLVLAAGSSQAASSPGTVRVDDVPSRIYVLGMSIGTALWAAVGVLALLTGLVVARKVGRRSGPPAQISTMTPAMDLPADLAHPGVAS